MSAAQHSRDDQSEGDQPHQYAGAGLPDLWALYGALRDVPVLAFRGEISDVLSPATFERMAEDMPKLTRVTVPGVGHTPTLAEPEVLSALDDFLAQAA